MTLIKQEMSPLVIISSFLRMLFLTCLMFMSLLYDVNLFRVPDFTECFDILLCIFSIISH